MPHPTLCRGFTGGRSTSLRWSPWVLVGVALLPGCGQWEHHRVREALLRPPPSTLASEAIQLDAYAIRAPDVIELHVPGRPDWCGTFEVQAHGCVVLPGWGGVRVAGLNASDAAQLVRQAAGNNLSDPVQIRVAEFRSQEVYLFGEVAGAQRAIPYHGPETVVNLLRRAGGITPDAAPSEVRVIRNPGLERTEPEVFHVDLRAILLDNDPRTNVVLQPFDQVFIPESPQAVFGKCLPLWFRPLARALYPAS